MIKFDKNQNLLCKREECDKKARKDNPFCSTTCHKTHFIEMKRLTELKIKWGFNLFVYTNDKQK